MTDESQDQPVLSAADRTLLKANTAPTDAQLEATRRALSNRLAALAAGAAVAQAASTAEATGAATAAATGAAATTTAAATHGLAAFGAAKWISAGLIVTAVAGGSVVATRESKPTERPHVASVAAPAPALAPASQANAAPEVAPAPAPAIVAPIERAMPADEAPAKVASAPTTERALAKPARRATIDPKPPRTLEGETLSAELALLHRARQTLAQGDAAGSLQALDAHAARFPNAVLRQEALSARALALCEIGRTADARRAAAQLERIAPRSPHLIRLADSCALEDADPSP